MTTQTEALKLALEALEMYCEHGAILKPIETRDAIKEALAQEKALQALHDENERLGLYKDAYAQPAVSETHKQEPTNDWSEWRGMVVQNLMRHGIDKDFARRLAHFYQDKAPQPKEPEQEPVAKAMTAHRAAYFMERFKHEEKLLGPNEQAALDFVISMLEAQPAVAPEHLEPVAHFGSAYINENGVHITTVLGPVAIPQDAKLYTTPLQRTWVGLTDEEKKNIFLKWYGKHWAYTEQVQAVMGSVETKLKEKNT